MKEIDRVFTKYPFFGSCQLAVYLRRNGGVKGRHRVRRLMATMGLVAIYKRPWTSHLSRRNTCRLCCARVIKNWMAFYNADRTQSEFDRQTPNDANSAGIEKLEAA